jgi:hypothetical protein
MKHQRLAEANIECRQAVTKSLTAELGLRRR